MNKGLTRGLLIASVLGVVVAAGLAGRAVLLAPDGAATAIARGIAMTGTPLVGGPFRLTDQHGVGVTDEDFRGEYLLIYFGYTYCPDVCPTSLQAMAEAIDALGEHAGRVRPIFFTIDPERDTVEAMQAYVTHFHPRMVGLTGTPEQVAAAAKAYRIYYRKAQDEGMGDYLMDHSSLYYLMGPDGAFLTHFPYGTAPERMAAAIARYLSAPGS
jgi:protein SCO1/2